MDDDVDKYKADVHDNAGKSDNAEVSDNAPELNTTSKTTPTTLATTTTSTSTTVPSSDCLEDKRSVMFRNFNRDFYLSLIYTSFDIFYIDITSQWQECLNKFIKH